MAIADVFGVTVDYLLERTDKQQICVDGLTDEQIQHINAIIKDILQK